MQKRPDSGSRYCGCMKLIYPFMRKWCIFCSEQHQWTCSEWKSCRKLTEHFFFCKYRTFCVWNVPECESDLPLMWTRGAVCWSDDRPSTGKRNGLCWCWEAGYRRGSAPPSVPLHLTVTDIMSVQIWPADPSEGPWKDACLFWKTDLSPTEKKHVLFQRKCRNF